MSHDTFFTDTTTTTTTKVSNQKEIIFEVSYANIKFEKHPSNRQAHNFQALPSLSCRNCYKFYML